MSAKQMLWVVSVVAVGMVFWAGLAQAGILNVDGLYELTGTTSESYTGVNVGNSGAGTLNIKDSASLTSSGNFYINNNGPLSTVNLTGGTLTFNYSGGDGFFIGWWGRGVMNISGGIANLAQLKFYDGELNLSGSGTLNVTGNDVIMGQWDRAGESFAISGGTANLRGVQLTWDISTLTLTGGTLNVGAGGIYGNAGSTINFSGGTLKLNDNGAIALALDSDTVDYLYIDGSPMAAGTWGKTGSGADHFNDTYFEGTGVLNVNLPEPATMALLAVGGVATLLRRKRK
ncbi:MAG: PEP-CTERM sorting domain-containing protein [Planctomycetota bacterium]|nr:PEP-CTERM sorting domain-containing protein [Planctomycetota bacterium]